MNKEAIELLQAINTSYLEDIAQLSTPIAVIPDNSSIKSLEQYNDTPDRFIAHYETHIISEFARYCNNHITDDSAIYIDPDRMCAQAIFDHGDQKAPKWGEHRSTVELAKTPAYSALFCGEVLRFSHQGMIDFLIDWKQHIVFNQLEFQIAINRIRRLTLISSQSNESEQNDFSHNASAMESIEVTSGNEKLPDGFLFMVEPYEEFAAAEFYCSLRAVTAKDKVQLKFRIESMENHIENIANEFREKIIAQLPESNIYIGTMQHR